MDDLGKWHNDVIGRRAADALKKNNFSADYFSSRQDAVSHVLRLVPEGASIGIPGSRTVIELGLAGLLKERGHELFDHSEEGLTPEEKNERRSKQLTCDVLLSSANAITLKGEIVNRDGAGNRVAAMIFGPKKVVIIAGTNKIVRDLEEAEERIRMYAAPINVKRLQLENPCAQSGVCVDCASPQRICNITTIISKRPLLTDMHVVVVGENLGF
jgi:hypothetical protein